MGARPELAAGVKARDCYHSPEDQECRESGRFDEDSSSSPCVRQD